MTEKRARKLIARADFISGYSLIFVLSTFGLILLFLLSIALIPNLRSLFYLFAGGASVISLYIGLHVAGWASDHYLNVWCLQGEPRLYVLQKLRQASGRQPKEIARFTENFPAVVKMRKRVVDLELPVAIKRSLHFKKYRLEDDTEVLISLVYDFADFDQFYAEVVEGQKLSVDAAMAEMVRQIQEHWEGLDFWAPGKTFAEESELATTLMVQMDEGVSLVSPLIKLRRCKVFFKSKVNLEFKLA